MFYCNNREVSTEKPGFVYTYCTEVYMNKIINTMIDNLSISCKQVQLKFIEHDIVIRIDISSFTLEPCYDDWSSSGNTGTTFKHIEKRIIDHRKSIDYLNYYHCKKKKKIIKIRKLYFLYCKCNNSFCNFV